MPDPSTARSGGDSLKSGPRGPKGEGGKPFLKAVAAEDPLRSMPLNADAERAALSCMLLDPVTIIPKAIESMNAEFFYIPAHRVIFETLLHLYKTRPGGTLDLIVLNTELSNQGRLDAVGGPKTLADLLDDVPTTALFDDYVGFLKEKFVSGASSRTAPPASPRPTTAPRARRTSSTPSRSASSRSGTRPRSRRASRRCACTSSR